MFAIDKNGNDILQEYAGLIKYVAKILVLIYSPTVHSIVHSPPILF